MVSSAQISEITSKKKNTYIEALSQISFRTCNVTQGMGMVGCSACRRDTLEGQGRMVFEKLS